MASIVSLFRDLYSFVQAQLVPVSAMVPAKVRPLPSFHLLQNSTISSSLQEKNMRGLPAD